MTTSYLQGATVLASKTALQIHLIDNGEPVDVKILPLRLEAEVVERMDETWRTRGIKNRMEFFRRALGHYLSHLGAEDAAAMFATGADVAG